MKNPFQHVDLRVNDHDLAWEFYSRILPALGFPEGHRGTVFSGFEGEGTPPSRPWFGFCEDREHRPNATRIAFQAESRARVDELAEIVRAAGARNVSGPRACPEYTPTYYAVFFEDPFGNCLEVCYRAD